MGRANPFTPAAGAEPPALIGCEDVLFDFEESLLAGVGAPRPAYAHSWSAWIG